MTAVEGGFLSALAPEDRAWLLGFAREMSFPAGIRIFDEDGPADRFWIVRHGFVVLDVHIPGRGAVVVESLGTGELLGWSWLFEPYRWYLGARTRSAVEAYEFDSRQVRDAMEDDPATGLALFRCIGDEVIGRRLKSARTRLLDLYAPPAAHGAGERGATP